MRVTLALRAPPPAQATAVAYVSLIKNKVDTRLETRFACASTPCRESRSSVATERLVFRVVTAAI